MYGLLEIFEAHLLTAVLWWASIFVALTAYKYRAAWDVGSAWLFMSLGFLSFGVRKALQLAGSPLLESSRYIFGIWAAVFLLFAFLFVFIRTCLRKKPSAALNCLPFALGLFALFIFAYTYEGSGIPGLDQRMGALEALVWMVQGMGVIYLTYMLGRSASGGFVAVYFLSQLAAFSAFTWKLLALVNPGDYWARELFEILFVVFSAAASYSLARMLRALSLHLGVEHDGK